ncbi:MAG: 2-amino-4-hydroxy-6-hydroxymethyldihydropteridine diphosphokinase [Coriobacteriia bacterium]
MSGPAGWELVAYDTGDHVVLTAVAAELEANGISVLWEPSDPRVSVFGPFGAVPTFSILVESQYLARAREVLGEEAPAGARFVWAPETVRDDIASTDDDDDAYEGEDAVESEDTEPNPFWDEEGRPRRLRESREELIEWASTRDPRYDELEIDDPAALEAAEAAVRGDAPAPSFARTHERPGEPAVWDPGWRSLVGWPQSEIARHRNVAYLGLGSNMGDRLAALAAALRALDALEETDVMGVSHVYESEPWGPVEQPAYANAVAVVSTALRADQLLMSIASIEESLGRDRSAERFGPRTIDIDILLFGDEEWQRPDLVIPHPRMTERQFVVRPLLEADPSVTLPDGSSIDVDAAREGRITGELGIVPGYERLTPKIGAEKPRPLKFVTEFTPAGRTALAPDSGWVAVEESVQGMMMGYRGAMTLQIHLGVLEGAGIPAVLDPPPIFSSPGVPHYAAMLPIRLMVPLEYEQQARRTLLEAGRPAREIEGSGGRGGGG